MVLVNGIPSEAIIAETIIALIITAVTFILFTRYRRKPRLSTFYLFMTILGYALAVWTSDVGKILDFTSETSQEVISYSGFTINFAYCLVAFANIFLYALIENVFLSNSRERKIVVAGIFGVIIGIITDLNSFEEGVYRELFPFILVFILFSFAVYGILIVVSLREVRKSDDRKVKLGFTFISLFGVFLFGIFLFFAMDIYKIETTGKGFNIEYYLGWISGALASIFAYIGFTMPDWVTKLFGADTS